MFRVLETYYSLAWNQFLTLISFANVVNLCFLILLSTKKLTPIPFHSSSHVRFKSLWIFFQKNQWILASIYVIACAIRGSWPRQDGSRYCFYDSPMSTVILGRSLATIAELSFCAQLCLALVSISGQTITANILFILNFVAQSCCWYSVITQDQRGHIFEESIWLVTGAVLTLNCVKLIRNKNYDKCSKHAKLFLSMTMIFGPLYLLFMSVIDIPMYYRRYIHDSTNNTIYQTFYEGYNDIFRCKAITQMDIIWMPEMPWMTLYFTFAVWSSMWLAYADISVMVADRNSIEIQKNKDQ